MKFKIKAKSMGMEVDVPVPSDVCGSLIKGSCPAKKGDKLVHQLNFTTPDIAMPKTKLTVTIVDDQERIVTCFKVTIKEVSPRHTRTTSSEVAEEPKAKDRGKIKWFSVQLNRFF